MIGLENEEKSKLLNIFEKYDSIGINHVSYEYYQEYMEIIALFEEVNYQTIDLLFNIHESLNKDGVFLKDDILKSVETVYESPDELKECLELYFNGDDIRDVTRKLFVENAKIGMYDDFLEKVYEEASNI